jgi:hypothetical protein
VPDRAPACSPAPSLQYQVKIPQGFYPLLDMNRSAAALLAVEPPACKIDENAHADPTNPHLVLEMFDPHQESILHTG